MEDLQSKIYALDFEDRAKLSDGYHTFNELYAHRIELFIALCNTMCKEDEFRNDIATFGLEPTIYRTWKSKLHADGTSYDGWYIAGIGTEHFNTITYHLPNNTWDRLKSPEVGHAPGFDGHTSSDVLNLLRKM